MTDERREDGPADVQSGAPGGVDDHAGHGRDPRLRVVAIGLAAGVAVALAGAVVTGVLGGSGGGAALVLLLVLGTTFAVTSLFALGTALVDEFRRRPVGRGRVVVGVVLFVATIVAMAMAGAAVGG